MNRFAAGFAVTLALAAPAFAQGVKDLPDGPIRRAQVAAAVKRQFAQLDTNHDGRVGSREFDAYRDRTGDSGGSGLIHTGAHWFEKSDANGDGRVTMAEAMARPMKLFDKADANHDGVVSEKERKIAMLMMGL